MTLADGEGVVTEKDWRTEIAQALMHSPGSNVKELKNFVLIDGPLYHRMPGGILARCVIKEEAVGLLCEVHEKDCGASPKVSLYRKL